jgi:hypothetical protein
LQALAVVLLDNVNTSKTQCKAETAGLNWTWLHGFKRKKGNFFTTKEFV